MHTAKPMKMECALIAVLQAWFYKDFKITPVTKSLKYMLAVEKVSSWRKKKESCL